MQKNLAIQKDKSVEGDTVNYPIWTQDCSAPAIALSFRFFNHNKQTQITPKKGKTKEPLDLSATFLTTCLKKSLGTKNIDKIDTLLNNVLRQNNKGHEDIAVKSLYFTISKALLIQRAQHR